MDTIIINDNKIEAKDRINIHNAPLLFKISNVS